MIVFGTIRCSNQTTEKESAIREVKSTLVERISKQIEIEEINYVANDEIRICATVSVLNKGQVKIICDALDALDLHLVSTGNTYMKDYINTVRKEILRK